MGLTAHGTSGGEFRFNPMKAIQAVALLLKQRHATKTDNYMRLLKLLYIADRESIKETGVPITSDRFIAMQRGPVLSRLLDMIKQQDSLSPEWDKWIERDRYDIRLIRDPGNGQLCRYEIAKLLEVWSRYADDDEWALVNETHKLQEWIKNDPGTSSKPIPLSDLLEAVNRADWLETIIKDADESADARSLFGVDC